MPVKNRTTMRLDSGAVSLTVELSDANINDIAEDAEKGGAGYFRVNAFAYLLHVAARSFGQAFFRDLEGHLRGEFRNAETVREGAPMIVERLSGMMTSGFMNGIEAYLEALETTERLKKESTLN